MNDTPSEALPGNTCITISGDMLLNLIDNLVKWENISQDQYNLPDGWNRSPEMREMRRQAVVYGNCLETVECCLGRREVRQLMNEARARKREAREA